MNLINNGDTVTVRTKQFSIANRSATAPIQIPQPKGKDDNAPVKKFWLYAYKSRKPEDYDVLEVFALESINERETLLYILFLRDIRRVPKNLLFDSEELARNAFNKEQNQSPVELKISSTVTLSPQNNE